MRKRLMNKNAATRLLPSTASANILPKCRKLGKSDDRDLVPYQNLPITKHFGIIAPH